MNSPRKGIVTYLLIAFGMAWICSGQMFRFQTTAPRSFLWLLWLFTCFAPAVACFIVRRWITREGFADAGLRLHLREWPYYLVAWFLPVLVVACIAGLARLFRVGTLNFASLDRGIKLLSSSRPLLAWAPNKLLPVTGILLLQAVVNIPLQFGEEFGWRGYLQKRLFPANPLRSAVVTGVIWGLWHLPFVIRGYRYPENSMFVAFFIYPVECILLSVIFGWLVSKTGSIWSASLAHASNNAVRISLVYLLFFGNLYVPSFYGDLLSMIPLAALSAWIVFTGQLQPTGGTVTRVPELSRTATAS